MRACASHLVIVIITMSISIGTEAYVFEEMDHFIISAATGGD